MNIHEYLDYEAGDNYMFPGHSLVHKHLSFLNNTINFSSKHTYHVAILGLPDNDLSKTFTAANQVRKELFELVSFSGNLHILDLGNVKTGHSFIDTCYAIREVTSIVSQFNILIVLIGGSSAYNLGSFLTFAKAKEPVNMVVVDPIIDRDKIPVWAALDLGLIDNNEASSLFNFINIGYQSYYVDDKFIDLLNDSYYEAYRLGYVRANMKEMEPVLRDANMLSFSLNSIKYSDAPGGIINSPNGFTGEEGCQLSFYAGHSNRMKYFGLFDLAPEKDLHNVTAKLGAQIIWYFLEALSDAIYEEPDTTPENFKKYLIHFNQSNQNITFFKSNLTNRWWMEISYPNKNRNLLLSCSESDYELACQQEIPDRWLRTFQRITHY